MARGFSLAEHEVRESGWPRRVDDAEPASLAGYVETSRSLASSARWPTVGHTLLDPRRPAGDNNVELPRTTVVTDPAVGGAICRKQGTGRVQRT